MPTVMQEALGWSGATAKEIIPIKITTAKNTSKAKQFITLRVIRIKFKQLLDDDRYLPLNHTPISEYHK